MGGVLTVLRIALAVWRFFDGWKSYTGAGLIAAGAVGYYASCPRFVLDGESSVWPSSELWVLILGLGSSLAVAGIKHALEKLKSAVNAEVYRMIVDIVRQAFNEAVKPATASAYRVETDMEPPAGGVGRVEPLPGGLTATKTPSGATTIGCLALLLCLAGVASAAPPKAVINGPTTGTAGELLTLDASQSEGENIKFLWRVTPDVAGRRLFRVCDKDPSRVSIASLPGTWAYTLVVSNADGADLLTWVVTIPGTPQPTPSPLPPRPGPDVVPPSPSPPMPPTPGPGPTPSPTPGPTPPGPRPPDPSPEPPVPVPLTGFAADVAGWVKLVISPTRDAEAKRLADACEATASAISAGAHNGPAAILAAIKAANNAALGSSLAAWGPFAARYTAALGIKYAAGELKTNEQWAAMLNETAKGLRGSK